MIFEVDIDRTLPQWAGAQVTFPEVFARAVAVNPHGVALRSGGSRVTYQALDRWTNRLARVLIGLGVGGGAALLMAVDYVVRLLARFARLHYTLLERSNAA